MSVIYELIGRLFVAHLRRRYGREIRMAAGAGAVLAAVGIAAYLATREDEDQPVD
jgi:hypothetical protein